MLATHPLPTAEPHVGPTGLAARWPALAVFLATAGVLMTAFMLTPNTQQGVGTHEALGLQPCGLEATTGIPCATCGMTTSFSLAAHGRFVESFLNQPAGAMLCLATAMACVVSGYALITGMSLLPISRAVFRPKVIIIGAAGLIIAWAYKIVIHTGLFGAGI